MADTVITCACGARVRAPATPGAAFRCPRCKAPLAVPLAAHMPDPVAPVLAEAPAPASLIATSVASGDATMCPICQSAVSAGESVIACPACDQTHHAECWAEVGGCSTFGCTQAPAVAKDEQAAQAPLTAWGDTKKCPACGETIKSIALRCRYCKTDFPTVDPLTTGDLRRQSAAQAELASFKRSVAVLFVVAVLAFAAPAMAVIAPIYVLPRRDKLAKSGPVFTIMGWTSIVLSWLYTLMMAAFYALGA